MIKVTDKPTPKAFTETAPGRPPAIITTVGITKYKPAEEVDEGEIIKKNALWDTGATHCCITKSTAAQLNLKPVRPILVKYGKGKQWTNAYLVNIYLSSKILVPTAVSECDDDDHFDIIIGMDVINQGDFAVTHKDGNSKFSFLIPPANDIDFTKDDVFTHMNGHEKTLPKHVIHAPMRNHKVDGNLPCPCGSGRKWKQCHGKPNSIFHK